MAMSWTHTIQWCLKIFSAQIIIITITSAASTVPPPIPTTTFTEIPTITPIESTTKPDITTVNVANQDDDSDEVAGLRAGLIVMTIIAIIAIGIIVVGVVLKLRKRRRRQQQKQTDMYDIVTSVAPSNPGDPNYSKPAVYGKDKTIATSVPNVDETPSEPTQDYENTNPDGNAPAMNSNGHPQLTSQVSVEGAVYEDFTNSSNQKNHQQPNNAPTVSAPAPPKQKKKDAAESTEIKDRSIPDVPDADNEAPGEMIYQNEDADSENPQLNAVYSALDMENSPTYDHTYMSMQKSD